MMKKLLKYILIAIGLWTIGYGLFVGSIFLAHTPPPPYEKTQAIVVLTGGEHRIESGLELFTNGIADELFISGVFPSTTEDDIRQKWGGDTPLPACCITLGHKATTTFQNATETKEWLEEKDFHDIRLVTADFHMNRAMVEFRYRLPHVKIVPHPITQPNTTPDKTWFWMISFIEYNKTLIRWAGVILTPPKNEHGANPHKHENEAQHS